MNEVVEIESKEKIRKDILDIESFLSQFPDAVFGDSIVCPLKHSFANGIYVREIFIPKGIVLTGKIHKHEHPNFLLKGEVTVLTEGGGVERLKAPMSMISKAGTKRFVYTHSDTTWVTCHSVGDETDLAKIEEQVIAKSYEEFEALNSGNKKLH